MKALFRTSCGRWSAVVRKAKPGTFAGANISLGVEIHCDGEEIISYGFCPEFKHLARTSRNHPGPALGYAELLGFTLSKLDRENLRLLVFATAELCDCLQQGGSVDHWCKSLGLRPVREQKMPRSANRPGPLAIHVKAKTFVLPSPRQLVEAKKGKPRRAQLPT